MDQHEERVRRWWLKNDGPQRDHDASVASEWGRLGSTVLFLAITQAAFFGLMYWHEIDPDNHFVGFAHRTSWWLEVPIALGSVVSLFNRVSRVREVTNDNLPSFPNAHSGVEYPPMPIDHK